MTHETIPNVEVLGGSRWSEDLLAAIAGSTTEDAVPVTVDGTPAGVLSNLRLAGGAKSPPFAPAHRIWPHVNH